MAKKKRKSEAKPRVQNSILDDARQMCYPAEFRIAAPVFSVDVGSVFGLQPITVVQPAEPPANTPDSGPSDRMIAEIATTLWYLKTKHFKRDWENEDSSDDDPRVRRALGRLNKGLDALKEDGVEIQDPTNKHYRAGSEGTMRPIQFDQTPGLTYQKVTDTVVPIVYVKGRIIQRGEVFVAVPGETPSHQPQKDVPIDAASGKSGEDGNVPTVAEPVVPAPLATAPQGLSDEPVSETAQPVVGNPMSDETDRPKVSQE